MCRAWPAFFSRCSTPRRRLAPVFQPDAWNSSDSARIAEGSPGSRSSSRISTS
ncbi:hypothetical protein [Streptomyces atacamensis]|uniref:hypothetical protein n=1 Tax=Streptomyces atacamensis TaxID=531966 RepID=UPI00399C58D3